MATRLRVYIAASVDGYIADPKGGVDWLDPYAAEDFGYATFFRGIRSVVMGRRSYEQVLGFGAWPYAGKRCTVLTRRPPPGKAPEGVAFRKARPAALAAELRGASQGDVWIMGGAETIAGFLGAGCIDSLELFVIPVLLGDGVPLFPRRAATRPLTLRGTRAYPAGVVRMTYRLPTVRRRA
jgi:dihydrofolate reductase